MMEIIVRKATKDDCPVIVTMIKELATFHGHPNDVTMTEDILLKDGFGENAWYFCLVAEVSEEEDGTKTPIGFVIYYKTYSTWNGKSFFMEDLYVKEAYRKMKVGTKFLKEITKHALSEGANKITWSALDWNSGAHEFYKNAGAEMVVDWNTFTFSKAAMERYVQK